jgi:DNA invertase Pin-like site-specific DNA recombinase
MRQAVIYTRFSPRRNADESESCEVQRSYCEKYAAANGLEVVAKFDDPDVSGADEYRERLWEAIQALPKGGVLLVYKRDRLARNVYLSEQINRAVEKRGATIEAVTGDVKGDSAETVMIRQVLAAIAEYERKMIASRTRHAMRFHMSQGRRMGAECPYGWAPDPVDPKRMVANHAEREVVEEIRSKHEQGGTFGGITRWLNEEKPQLARHGKWNVKTVRKLCLSITF